MNKIQISYFLGTLNLFLQFVQNIVIVPLILSSWGKQNYELIVIFSSFILLIKSLNTGFSTWFSSESFKINDKYEHSWNDFISSSIKISLLIGIIEFVITFFWSKYYFNIQISLLSLLIYLLINCLLNVVPNIVGRLLLVENKYNVFIYFGLQNSFLQILSLLILLKFYQFNFSKYLIAISIPILLHNIILYTFIKKKYPSFLPKYNSGSFMIGFKFFIKSILVTINNFLEQFNLSIIVLLLNKLSMQYLIAQFNTMKIASNTTTQLQSVIVNPHLPNSIKDIHNGKWNSARKMHRVNNLWTIILLVSFLILFDNYFERLFNIWLLKKVEFNKEYFHLIFLSILLSNLGKPIYQILQGLNKNKEIIFINLIKFIFYLIVFLTFIKINIITIGYIYLFIEGIMMVILPLYFDHKISKTNILSLDFTLTIFSILILFLFYLLSNFQFNSTLLIIFFTILNLFVLIFYIKNLITLKQLHEIKLNEK